MPAPAAGVLGAVVTHPSRPLDAPHAVATSVRWKLLTRPASSVATSESISSQRPPTTRRRTKPSTNGDRILDRRVGLRLLVAATAARSGGERPARASAMPTVLLRPPPCSSSRRYRISPPATTISRSRGSRSWVRVISSSPSISVGQVVPALGDLAQARDLPRLSEPGLVVVGLVLEEEGHDPLRDQVAPVDAREALRNDGAHAQLRGGQRRVLAARALAVVVAGDDEASAPLLRPARELRVSELERELGDRGHVRAERHHGRAVRREIAGRDVVRRDDQHAQRRVCREAPSARAAA